MRRTVHCCLCGEFESACIFICIRDPGPSVGPAGSLDGTEIYCRLSVVVCVRGRRKECFGGGEENR